MTFESIMKCQVDALIDDNAINISAKGLIDNFMIAFILKVGTNPSKEQCHITLTLNFPNLDISCEYQDTLYVFTYNVSKGSA